MVRCKTSFTFLCSKDFLRITDGVNKIFGLYCGNKIGQNLLVTGDKVQIIFHSDDKIERKGYLINFTLVSPASVSPDSVSSGKWDHTEANKTYGIHQFYFILYYLYFIVDVNIIINIWCFEPQGRRDLFNPVQTYLLGFLRGPAPKKRPMTSGSNIESADFYFPSRGYRILFKN